jgi:hypothetical protein
MTAPGAGGTRPARAAGLLLMGIAVIAVVLGVITLVDGNAENNGGGGTSQPPTASTTATTRPSGSQTMTANPPPSTGTTQTQPPPTSQTNTNTQTPQPPNPKQVPVRVFNNSKINGLAEKASNDFRAGGWTVVETGNYPGPPINANLATTTVFFRPGTDEEAAAKALADQFHLVVGPRVSGTAGYGPGVVVIVTQDYTFK